MPIEPGRLLMEDRDIRFVELSSYYDVDVNGVVVVEQTIAAIDLFGGVNLIEMRSGTPGPAKIMVLSADEMRTLFQECRPFIQQDVPPSQGQGASSWDVPLSDLPY